MTSDGGPNVGTVERYSVYLTDCPPKEYVLKMLRANALGPTTSAELARAAGWDSYRAANLHYGTFAKSVGRALSLTLDRYERDDTEFFTSAIANARRVPGAEVGVWEYELHPELLQALRRHGII